MLYQSIVVGGSGCACKLRNFLAGAVLVWLGSRTAAAACGDAGSCGVKGAAPPLPPDRPCPCDSPELCKPIQRQHAREVFGFSTRQQDQYAHYDWSQLTTVAWNTDPALMCLAHSKGARVVLNAGVTDARWLTNATARQQWVAAQLAQAQALFMDGINFDLEVPLQPGSPEALAYTALVRETVDAFHAAIPGSQISVDFAWSPHGIDGRHFDWTGLAAAADLLFIMAYDMQSQIWGSCVASANTPLALMERGLDQWLTLGVPAAKMVLGLPWYGYRYDCVNALRPADDGDTACTLAPESFRGCPCSDAVGRQKEYQEVMQLTKGNKRRYDAAQQSPYFTTWNGTVSHQVWYDDPQSLRLKAAAAAARGLRGVGVWHLDCLDYRSSEPGIRDQTRQMWAALQPFTAAPGGAPLEPVHSAAQRTDS